MPLFRRVTEGCIPQSGHGVSFLYVTIPPSPVLPLQQLFNHAPVTGLVQHAHCGINLLEALPFGTVAAFSGRNLALQLGQQPARLKAGERWNILENFLH